MNRGILFLIISIIWVASEIILARLKRSGSSDPAQDKHSLRILWITIAVCVNIGIFLGFWGKGFIREGSFTISVTGLAFIIIGLIVRWISIISLRRFFTVDINIAHDHRLVTKGIYRIIRHPAYSGSLLSFLGLGMVFSSWISVAVIFIPILLAFLYRIRVEEKALIAHFGDEYVRYSISTKRLIPRIY